MRSIGLVVIPLVTASARAVDFDFFLTQQFSYVARYDGQTGMFQSRHFFGGESMTDLVCGPDGNLYRSDVFMVGVHGFRPTDWTTAYNTSGGTYATYGLAFTPNRQYLYTVADLPIITRFNGFTGEYLGIVAYGGASGYRGFNVGPDGALYSSSTRIDVVTGQSAYFFEPGLYEQVGTATFDLRGNYYMACAGGRVLQWNATTGEYNGVFAETGGLDIWDFTIGPDGNLYVVSKVTQASFDAQVLKFDGMTGQLLGVAVPQQPNMGLFSRIAIAPVPEGTTVSGLLGALLAFRLRRKSGNLDFATRITR